MINRKFFKSSFIIALAILISMETAIPAFASVYEYKAIVGAYNVNIRTNPSIDSEVIGVLDKYDMVEVTPSKEPNGFCAITVLETDNKNLIGKKGWVHSKYLKVIGTPH